MSEVPGPSPTAQVGPAPELVKQCCICTRKDRKLLHLCLVNGGSNSLFSLLCNDQDDSPDGNKEPTRLIICWECDAIMSKIVRFRQQACKAQKRLSSIAMAQNTLVLRPALPRDRDAILPEYHVPNQNEGWLLPRPQLRVVRYELPDGTPALPPSLPRDETNSHHSSLMEFLVGIHQ